MDNKINEILAEHLEHLECCYDCYDEEMVESNVDICIRAISKPIAMEQTNPIIKTDHITYAYSFNRRELNFETETYYLGSEEIVDVCILDEDKRYIFMLLSNKRLVIAEYGNLENKMNFCKDVVQMTKTDNKLFFLVQKEDSCYVNEVVFKDKVFTHKIASPRNKLIKNGKLVGTNGKFYLSSDNRFYDKDHKYNLDYSGCFIHEYRYNTVIGKVCDKQLVFKLYNKLDCTSVLTVDIDVNNCILKACDNFLIIYTDKKFNVIRILFDTIEFYDECVVDFTIFNFDFYIFNRCLFLTILTDNQKFLPQDCIINLTDRNSTQTLKHIKSTSHLGFYLDIIDKPIDKDKHKVETKVDKEVTQEESKKLENMMKINEKESSIFSIEEIKTQAENITMMVKELEEKKEEEKPVAKENFTKKAIGKILKKNSKNLKTESQNSNTDSVATEETKKTTSSLHEKEERVKTSKLKNTPPESNKSDKNKTTTKSKSDQNKAEDKNCNVSNQKTDRFIKYIKEKVNGGMDKKTDVTSTERKQKCNSIDCNDISLDQISDAGMRTLLKYQQLMINQLEARLDQKISAAVEKAMSNTDVYKNIVLNTFVPKMEACVNEIRTQALLEFRSIKNAMVVNESNNFTEFKKTLEIDPNEAIKNVSTVPESELNELMIAITQNTKVLNDLNSNQLVVLLRIATNAFTLIDLKVYVKLVDLIFKDLVIEEITKENLQILAAVFKKMQQPEKDLAKKAQSIWHVMQHISHKLKKRINDI